MSEPSQDQRLAQPTTHIDRDGTVHVHGLRLPPSGLWSAEYRAFHTSCAAAKPATEFPAPARNAPKSEWDRFDSWWEQRTNVVLLKKVRSRYPVEVSEKTIAGFRVAMIEPKQGPAKRNERRVLVNLRGGGFVYNRGLSFGQIESIPVAAIGGFRIVTLDYRQAPFHSFPAASEDVAAVYSELLREHSPETIGIFGSSAGGTLVAQSVAWLHAAGLPRPGAIAISGIAPMPCCDRPPWGDGWGDSGVWFSGLLPKNEMSPFDTASWEPVLWYMTGASTDDPLAYPGGSDAVLARFPPTLLLSGTRDFAVSSVVFSHARLLKLGVDASLYIMEGAGHLAHVVAAGTPEAHDAQTCIANWFDSRLGT